MAAYMILMFVLAALAGGYAYSLIRRIMGFYGLDVKKNVFKVINIALAITVTFSCVNLFSTSAMVILHILVSSMVLDLAALVVRRMGKNSKHGKAYKVWRKVHGCGIMSVVITGIIFAYGYVNMNHIVQTKYAVTTDKKVNGYKVVLITDTHYGTIQDTDLLKEKAREISAQTPDIVVLGGDIVDEGTTKERMREVFSVLGGIESRYGVYYVYGNHDRQPYTNSRSYTDEELENAILAGGVTILEDSYTEINDDLVLAGRGDAAWGNDSGRASTEEILKGADRNKYIIMVDHQPIEAEENDAQFVDLELSGHTHAGQIWPTGLLTELTGGLNYGKYQRGNCNVVVSSGFAGWGYPVRTGKHCEYVVVEIQP